MRSSIVLTVVVAAGCMIGPTTRNFAPATGPQGIAADLRVKWGPKGRVQGELLSLVVGLEVHDTALMVLSSSRLVLVPLRVIQMGRFKGRGTLIENGRARRSSLEQLQLVSRFPDGMKPEVMARLLAAYGQTQPDGAP